MKNAGVVTRALNRARHMSIRARNRVRNLPIRAANKGGLPIPPSRLIYLVAGTDDASWFLDSGGVAADCLREVLGKNGVELDRLGAILDFGCGVGRVLRHWQGLRGPELHGTDYNPDLIAWCERNLPFARFRLNGLDRGPGYPDGSFDLIYALSVFTHLSEPLQAYWMGEMARLLRPGGHLFFTVHGESYLPGLPASEAAQFRRGELVVHRSRRDGSNDCAVFHPEPYVRRTLADGLDVVDFLPEGARGNPHQDVYLLRKP